MNQAYFITGTDTGVGKTLVTIAMLNTFKMEGFVACGMKPIASGCEMKDDKAISEDAMLIKNYSSMDMPYNTINPLAFLAPCSPNISADLDGKKLDIQEIIAAYNQIAQLSEVIIVEGVGGWRCPAFSAAGMADLVRQLKIPVILVVGIKLGCLNHALLSVESILRDNASLAGWVANVVSPDFLYSEATINYLRNQISAPLLGQVPYQENLNYGELHKYISVQGILPLGC
jgi:dethiobiotin synthetase